MKNFLLTLLTSACLAQTVSTVQQSGSKVVLTAQSGASVTMAINANTAALWVLNPPLAGGPALGQMYSVAAGAVITIPWSGDSNPSSGGWETSTSSGCGYTGLCPVTYSFTNFDAAIAAQLGYGALKVRVVLSAVAFGGSNNQTPNYIFDSAYAAHNSFTQQFTCADTDYTGNGSITQGNCAQGTDNTAAPIYWLTTEPFRPRWIAAVVAAVNHIAGCAVITCGYSSLQIDSVRPGGGLGGEWFPWGTSAMVFQVYGAVNSTTLATFKIDWMAYVTAMETTVNAASSGLHFIQSENGGVNGGHAQGNTPIPYSWADNEASIAHANGWGHGDQGLTGNWTGATGNNSDILRFAAHGYASGTTNVFSYPSFDSAFVFHTYPTDRPLEMQTGGGGASDPTGASSPGSLLTILPYATNQAGATDIELYYEDWRVAFDTSDTNYGFYHLSYQAAIAAASLPLNVVQLPLNWVNSKEYIGNTTNTITFPSSGSGGGWTCGVTNYGPYTAGSQSSANQAIADAESCRTANGSGTKIVFPAGALYSGSAGIILPQTAGDTSTNFIVLTSSSPLTTGQTACSHGIQDNVAESTQPGIRNLGCNATSLSYQLGTTVTSVSGSFTLANGTATSASAYNDIASMYTFECTGTNCNALSTATFDANNVGPHHFAILNAEIRPQAGLTLTDAPVKIGLGTETLTSQLVAHIHFAYDYVHGDWTDAPVSGGAATGSPTGANSIPNDIYWASCSYCSISYSYVDRSIRPGAEGHTLAILYGQQLKIVHNWFEGQSSGRFCGGQSVTLSLANFLGCTDGEERGNRFTYPYSWLLAWQGNFCVNSLTCAGNGYERKNGSEFKNVQRGLSDGNIYENVDNSGAQNGTTYSVKTANGSGGVTADNYWLTAANLTTTDNIFRSSCNGPSWGDTSTIQGSNGNGTTLPTQIALWQNNLLYNVNTGNPGCTNGGGTTNSSTPQYGFRNASSAGSTWTASATRDAAGLTSTLTLTSVAGGLQADVRAGDPVQVVCPSDTSFSTSLTALGPIAAVGTFPNSLTITYANAGTANATTSGCTFQNGQGYANYLTYNHNSNFLTNASYANDPYNSANCGPTVPDILGRYTTYTNSIFVGGGINNSGCGEGTRTETEIYDPNTEQVNYVALPGRDSLVTCPGHSAGAGGIAACYTEYSSTHAAITPPVTLWGTDASFCTGNDPTTGNCVGVLGAMSAGSFPSVLNDWNQYRLCHLGDSACNDKASLYATGGAKQASDGTDLGFNPITINSAEVSNKYVCKTPCGATGPYADN